MAARNRDWMGYNPEQLIPRLRTLCDDLSALEKGGKLRLEVEPVELENWSLLRRAVPCLIGNMSGHPHIREGNFGCTTEIYYLDHDLGLARSLSRWYRLSKPLTTEPSKALADELLKL